MISTSSRIVLHANDLTCRLVTRRQGTVLRLAVIRGCHAGSKGTQVIMHWGINQYVYVFHDGVRYDAWLRPSRWIVAFPTILGLTVSFAYGIRIRSPGGFIASNPW